RFIRFMILKSYYEINALHWLFGLLKAIPVPEGNRKGVIESIKKAREELTAGHLVCIFAEGSISRTGNLLPFKRGLEKSIEGLDVPVIPVHLDGLWGSIFSFKGRQFFWKWPERIPYPVTISFGRPLPSTATTQEVRQAVIELGSEAVQYRRTKGDLLHQRFIKSAKKHSSNFCMADSSGKELTYGKTLVGSLLLARWIRKELPEDNIMVGVLLPASVAGALTNIAILLAGKIPVNLNFTAGKEAMESAIKQCNIKTIITSRVFLAKARVEDIDGMVFLEDLMGQITTIQKTFAFLFAFILPYRLLQTLYRHGEQNPDALATVIFSSGSTGIPKGVMLSHNNILSNIEGFAQVISTTKVDRVMGILPFFHSFGFTGTLWFPLLSGCGAVYHANPMDAKTIGEMVSK
ncbi:MAG: AMP-binding protein, partial [Nitrospirota bacterium]